MRSRIKIARDPFDQVDPINNKKLFKMPYTRAYQLPVQEVAAEAVQLNIEETPTKLKPMLNITPSSNWIQETFNARDIVSEEVETDGVTTTTEVFLIEKSKKLSLYQRFSDMQTRAELFSIRVVASNPVPNAETRERFIDQANGDDNKLAELTTGWETEIIGTVTETSFVEFIDRITEEEIYLRAELFLRAGLESIRLTFSSPEVPTRGDTPITAILYSPVAGGRVAGEVKVGVTGITGREIPFTWIDKSGFESTMLILPNVIYEIQPVSIGLDYSITLLA